MPVTDWAQYRPFPFRQIKNLSQLSAAWQFSARRLVRISESLEDCSERPACVAVSGSLSRMEGHEGSDLDLLIVVDDRVEECSAVQQAEIYSVIWETLQHESDLRLLKPPKPGGVFSACASWKAMTDPSSRGVVDSDITTFGQRMQLLIDAQPVAGHAAFSKLRRDLLTWYSESRVAAIFAESGPFHWLWQDVQRYWRSIRSRACWLHSDEPRKSLEVNLKLRSSRLVLIAGFLHALSVAQTSAKNMTALLDDLERRSFETPLERLFAAMSSGEKRNLLLRSYQMLWQHIADLSDDAHDCPESILTAIHDLNACVRSAATDSADWIF